MLVKFVQFADHHVRRAPVRSPAIPLSGERRCGGKQQFVQHVAGVQFFGENLKGNAGERGLFNQLPEICRTATVVVVVTMMEGPDAIASAFEDLAAENPEAETEDDVEIMSADALDGIGREAMRETLGDGRDGKACHAVQKLAAVDWLQRVRLERVPSRVEH